MMNRQTISVPSATSGDLFVIKDETTINPVERIYQRVVAPHRCCCSLVFSSREQEDYNATRASVLIYASIIPCSCVSFSFFFFCFFFWGGSLFIDDEFRMVRR